MWTDLEGCRYAATLALAVTMAIGAAAPAAAADPIAGTAGADVTVAGTTVKAGLLPRASRDASGLDPMSASSLDVPARSHTFTPRSGSPQDPGTNTGALGAEAVGPTGFSAFTDGYVASSDAGPAQATGARIGSSMLTGSNDGVAQFTTTGGWVRQWTLKSFFTLASNQYYWGAFVASSLYRSRYVAVLPSFDDTCGKGWLNVAVSTSSNPAGTWRQFKIPMTDAWTDAVSIGVSDDKVVIAANEWDLMPGECLASTFEGSRIRVMDWADLLDGGTLTVRDVSSTPRTSYYSWTAAASVPGMTTTAAGNSVRLAGDKNAGGWGHVAYASVTGSARAGTAKLTGLSDLTVTRSLEPLISPPMTIAAFPSGNGYQDEGVVSVAARGSRMWFSSNASCSADPDPGVVACARFTQLDLSATPPLVVDQGWFYAPGTDTFHPLVGVTRGASAFFTMTRAAATGPLAMETYATYRDLGAPIVGGVDEELVGSDSHTPSFDAWPASGSIVADPSQADTAWAVVPVICYEGLGTCASQIRLRSRLSAAPGGTATLGEFGTGWTFTTIPPANFQPNVTSPIKWVRVAATPETEVTAEGLRLVAGTTWPSSAREYPDLTATAAGGGVQGDTLESWVQWGTGSAWSEPILVTATIDVTEPIVILNPIAFTKGTVGTTVPVRMSWSATDPETGIGGYQVVWNCGTGSNLFIGSLPPTTRTHTWALRFGRRCGQAFVVATNGGGYGGQSPDVKPFTASTAQGGASSLAYRKTWSTQASSRFLAGSTRYATSAGATVTYSFTGRAVGFVSTLGPKRGRAEIWVDGILRKTIDLKASTTRYRQLVWSIAWPTAGAHTMRVKVLGTSGRPRVDADAFVRF